MKVIPVLQSTVQLAWMRQFCILNTVTIPVEIFRIYFVSASLRIRVIRPSDSSQPWHASPHSMDAGWLTYWIFLFPKTRESPIHDRKALKESQLSWIPRWTVSLAEKMQEAPVSKGEVFLYPVSRHRNAVTEASSTRAVNYSSGKEAHLVKVNSGSSLQQEVDKTITSTRLQPPVQFFSRGNLISRFVMEGQRCLLHLIPHRALKNWTIFLFWVSKVKCPG